MDRQRREIGQQTGAWADRWGSAQEVTEQIGKHKHRQTDRKTREAERRKQRENSTGGSGRRAETGVGGQWGDREERDIRENAGGRRRRSNGRERCTKTKTETGLVTAVVLLAWPGPGAPLQHPQEAEPLGGKGGWAWFSSDSGLGDHRRAEAPPCSPGSGQTTGQGWLGMGGGGDLLPWDTASQH